MSLVVFICVCAYVCLCACDCPGARGIVSELRGGPVLATSLCHVLAVWNRELHERQWVCDLRSVQCWSIWQHHWPVVVCDVRCGSVFTRRIVTLWYVLPQ